MFTSQFAQGPLIAALFQSFEVSFQKISPFSSRIKSKLFETLSDATESNAQRNKLSLQATTSSGISHFRKTHLKRREVVMFTSFKNQDVYLKKMHIQRKSGNRLFTQVIVT